MKPKAGCFRGGGEPGTKAWEWVSDGVRKNMSRSLSKKTMEPGVGWIGVVDESESSLSSKAVVRRGEEDSDGSRFPPLLNTIKSRKTPIDELPA